MHSWAPAEQTHDVWRAGVDGEGGVADDLHRKPAKAHGERAVCQSVGTVGRHYPRTHELGSEGEALAVLGQERKGRRLEIDGAAVLCDLVNAKEPVAVVAIEHAMEARFKVGLAQLDTLHKRVTRARVVGELAALKLGDLGRVPSLGVAKVVVGQVLGPRERLVRREVAGSQAPQDGRVPGRKVVILHPKATHVVKDGGSVAQHKRLEMERQADLVLRVGGRMGDIVVGADAEPEVLEAPFGRPEAELDAREVVSRGVVARHDLDQLGQDVRRDNALDGYRIACRGARALLAKPTHDGLMLVRVPVADHRRSYHQLLSNGTSEQLAELGKQLIHAR